MSRLIDLREHFGIWEHCGNTRFFYRDSAWGRVYVNPLDGLVVLVRPETAERSTLKVLDLRRLDEREIKDIFALQDPWVGRAIRDFMMSLAMSIAIDVVNEEAGVKRQAGDWQLRAFMQVYKAAGPIYRREGSSKDMGDPSREELLEAVYRTAAYGQKAVVDHRRGLSMEEVESAIGDLGILEC